MPNRPQVYDVTTSKISARQFYLVMRTPFGDFIRLLRNQLKLDDEVYERWLIADREMRFARVRNTQYLKLTQSSEDSTPKAIRAAAYKVEARRSILRRRDEIVTALVMIAAVWAGVTAATLNVVVGVLVAIVGTTLAAIVHNFGSRRAIEVTKFHYGTEPLAWALYYVAQDAERLADARETFAKLGDRSLTDVFEKLQDEVEREPDGTPRPGQEKQLEAMKKYFFETMPGLLLSRDSARDVARYIADRATAASVMVRGDYVQTLGRGPSGTQIANELSKQAYNYLLLRCSGLATMQRARHDKEIWTDKLDELGAEPQVQGLAAALEALKGEVDDLASGKWPIDVSGSFSVPTGKAASVFTASLGVGVVVVGFVMQNKPEFKTAGEVVIAMGSTLVPGVWGKFAKEASSLRVPAQK